MPENGRVNGRVLPIKMPNVKLQLHCQIHIFCTEDMCDSLCLVLDG